MGKRMSMITLVSRFAALALVAGSANCLADNPTMQTDQPTQIEAMRQDSLLVWPRDRFSANELQGLNLKDLKMEPHFCGCYDKPNKHYPYLVVLLKTSQGDLVTRPERMEGAVTYMPLAVRRGIQYCELESEKPCYGSFPDPCEFTDFRYGPHLAPFFPTCKAD